MAESAFGVEHGQYLVSKAFSFKPAKMKLPSQKSSGGTGAPTAPTPPKPLKPLNSKMKPFKAGRA